MVCSLRDRWDLLAYFMKVPPVGNTPFGAPKFLGQVGYTNYAFRDGSQQLGLDGRECAVSFSFHVYVLGVGALRKDGYFH